MHEPGPSLAAEFAEHLAEGDFEKMAAVVQSTPPEEASRLIDRLDAYHQGPILTRLDSECVAALLSQLPHVRAAVLLRTVPPASAAAALKYLPSNDQVDLIAALEDDAKSILAEMPAETSERLLGLSAFQENTAGGLMVTEHLSYHQDSSVADVIADLRSNAVHYSRLDVQYAYVVDDDDRLVGTLRLRDLLLLSPSEVIKRTMREDLQTVTADVTLDRLQKLFDRLGYLGLPVVSDDRGLLGVVLKTDVEEALALRTERTYLLMSGLLGGDELRSMPWTARVARRAPWLAVSLLLSVTAASVIGWYEETLAAVISLAVFLPVISGVGGNAGNQSLALSIRELSLASILGGIIPLGLKLLGWDPALASGPILFTTVDLCGFLFTLWLADLVLL